MITEQEALQLAKNVIDVSERDGGVFHDAVQLARWLVDKPRRGPSGRPLCPKCETDEPEPLVGNTRSPESLRKTQHGGKHYKGMAIQPAEYCHRNKLQFCESEAIKYLSRFRNKNGVEDVRKAIHFAIMILDMEYGETYDTAT